MKWQAPQKQCQDNTGVEAGQQQQQQYGRQNKGGEMNDNELISCLAVAALALFQCEFCAQRV